MKILLVDDDRVASTVAERVLTAEGYDVVRTENALQAAELMEVEQFDLLLLDIVMPDISGVDMCRRLRADPYRGGMPIIFLTAKDRPQDIAIALDAGGDDYVTKGNLNFELPARIRALMRRVPQSELDTTSETITIGDLELHRERPELRVRGALCFLTPIQHRLLRYLMSHPGHPISQERLLEDVWEYPPGVGNPNLVRTHVTNLRNKIEDDPHNPTYILNIHGEGYMVAS